MVLRIVVNVLPPRIRRTPAGDLRRHANRRPWSANCQPLLADEASLMGARDEGFWTPSCSVACNRDQAPRSAAPPVRRERTSGDGEIFNRLWRARGHFAAAFLCVFRGGGYHVASRDHGRNRTAPSLCPEPRRLPADPSQLRSHASADRSSHSAIRAGKIAGARAKALTNPGEIDYCSSDNSSSPAQGRVGARRTGRKESHPWPSSLRFH